MNSIDEAVRRPARLDALQRTGLLDSPVEEAFDRYTRLASKILRAPVALVSLVDADRQFFKSQVGLPEPWAGQRQTLLSHSFCQHVVAHSEPLVVVDATKHSLLKDNLAIRDLAVVAYLGVPLTTTEGETLGAFCTIDSQPRDWTDEEVEIVTQLAASVLTEIELRLRSQQLEQRAAEVELERSERLALLNSTGQGIYGVDLEGRCTFINSAGLSMLGFAASELLGVNMHDKVHNKRLDGSLYPQSECPISRVLQTGVTERFDNEALWRRDGTCFPVEYLSSPIVQDGVITGAVVSFVDNSERSEWMRRLRTQHAVSSVLAQATDFIASAPVLLKAIGDGLEWQVGSLWELDHDHKVLHCRATWQAADVDAAAFETATRQLTFEYGRGLPGRVWAAHQPLWSVDVLRERDFPRAPMAEAAGLHAAIAFPIHSGDHVRGVVEFFSRRMLEPDTLLLQSLASIGQQMGQFIDRQEAERAVRNSEARKTAILDTALDCIITMDHEGRIVEWNRAAENTFGYHRSDVIGKEMAELIVPLQFRERHRQGLTDYLVTGEGPVLGKRIELYACRADGSEFPVELAISRVPNEHPPIFTGFVRDISERRRTEEAIRERDQLLQGMFNSLSSQVAVLDRTGHIIYVSKSWERFAEANGADPSTVGLGVNYLEVCQRAARKNREARQALAGIRGVMDGRLRTYSLEYPCHAPREQRWFVMQVDPMPTEHGGAVITHSNITERKQAEKEIADGREAAEAANRAKSTFLANMSHELRTPLNAVILYSELLQEEAADANAEQFIPDLEKIRRAGKQLLSLVNDVLDLSKIEAGKMDIHLETFDVAELMKETVDTVQPLVDRNGNTLDVHITPEVGKMRGDISKVRQILINLLSNAAKFTTEGIIRVDVERVIARAHDWMIIRVSDTGIGMSQEQLGRLFQPFSQADASTTRKYGGTGLGLAISKRFCQLLGGDLTARSIPGEGSIFTVSIPAMVAGPATLQTENGDTLAAEGAVMARTVLVIDDDPGVRDLMRRFLHREGFSVRTAATGEDGLRLSRQLRPDVITLDIMMPQMDGWAVLTALKSDPELANIPVILLTIVDQKNLGYALGAAEYLTKPIDRERLIEVLKRHTQGGTGQSVLIVDDDPAMRRHVRTTLKRQGLIVLEANHGKEALTLLKDKTPALILLDLVMPEMDGFELAAALRRDPRWRSIPIVVLTGKDLTAEERLWLSGQVGQIITKSGSSREDLLEEVSRLLGGDLLPLPSADVSEV